MVIISLNNWGFASYSDYGLNIKEAQLLLFSIIFLLTIFLIIKTFRMNWVIYYTDFGNIPKWKNLLDYYVKSFPLFLIVTGISIMTFITYWNLFLVIGIVLYFVGAILFLILGMVKIEIDSNLNYLMNRAFNIYLLEKNKNALFTNGLFINKFEEYFSKALKKLDLRLEKGLELRNLRISEDLDLIFFVSHYSPIYLKYAEKDKIGQFETDFNLILNSISQKDDLTSLDAIKGIKNIHTSIAQFLLDYQYIIPKSNPKKRLLSKLNQSFPFISMFFLISFIILGILKDFISFSILLDGVKIPTGIEYDDLLLLIPPILIFMTQIIQTLGNIYFTKVKKY